MKSGVVHSEAKKRSYEQGKCAGFKEGYCKALEDYGAHLTGNYAMAPMQYVVPKDQYYCGDHGKELEKAHAEILSLKNELKTAVHDLELIKDTWRRLSGG